MASIDLHALANSAPFGAAREALIKAGHWDERAGAPDERKFRVTVEYRVTETTALTVMARSAEEAEELATEEVEDDWDADVISAEAIEDKEQDA
ncbi:hypothetical protein [Thioclava kandeliae]|uniref:Uncharacterized protein n=1 Tax=Thioclava kandeliae TaxID=3070818 RepID=A0ABV1SFW1_9RHOB